MIPPNIINEILERTDLAAIVGETVKLKKSGSKYVCSCPFHGDSTPSFYIYSDGHYHCYGCQEHGNAINYVMKRDNLDFPEAVRFLAARAGVEIKEKTETETERARRMEVENLYACMETVYRDYLAAFKNSQVAQGYAYSRWGKEFCNKAGIGFAPGGRYIADKPYNKETLKKLGLINDKGYDFLFDRIVIPIRDRWHKVIGFTARRMDSEKKFKYVNSCESAIYKKSQSLFGIDTACANMGKGGLLYLVEGASDCLGLQSKGVQNVVACLGSAWTDGHFKEIKKLTDRICFIPDSDPADEGKAFGTGYEAVFKAGRRALELGFTVSVKAIPNDTDGKKDPDSFFTSKELFDSTPDEDFILWYAREHFAHADTPSDKSAVVRDVSELLSSLDSKTQVSMYLDELKKFSTGKRVWLQAIEGERQRIEDEKVKTVKDSVDEMEKKYGFHIEDNKYYSVTDKGTVHEWSNFILIPRYLILDEENPQRLFRMVNEHGHDILINLDPADIVSLSQFRVKVEQKGNFIWKATEKELIKLKSYLFSNTTNVYPIKQLGWQQEGFFAFGNGVAVDGKFYETDDDGIVTIGGIGTFFIAANASYNRRNNRLYSFEHKFVHKNESNITLREFTSQYFKVFGDNARVTFSFLLATLFKDIVLNTTGFFPILNVFGPKGCGKSDMTHCVNEFFIRNHKAQSLKNTTMAALGVELASVCNAIIHLEEYKNDIGSQRIELAKGAWEGMGRQKMHMDKSGKKEVTSVDCGIILTGQEMPTEDIALFTRLIFLRFPRSEFTLEEKDEHKKLMKMIKKGMTHLTIDLLRYRDIFEKRFQNVYEETYDTAARLLENSNIEDRILGNWVVALAAYRTLEMELGVDLSTQELMDICIDGIKNQSKETKSNSELGSFFNMLEFLVRDGDMVEECDFKIVWRTEYKGNGIHCQWKEPRPVLYLQRSRVFVLYKMRMRSAGENVIPEESLRYYLEQSRAYLGEKNMRYHVSIKGVPQVDTARSTSEKICYEVTSQRSYCFDYQLLQKIYGINLGKLKEETNIEE